ncbi:MAG: dihydrolipoyl dehydrogenase [Bacteroidales bacterium]
MYDLVIIGSGPAGYVAAIRAGQVGLKTAIIERDAIGGMCLNWGCIPSKSIMESVKLYQRITKDSSRFGIEGIDKKNILFNWSKAVKRADGIVKKLTTGVEFLLKKNGVDIFTANAKIVSPTKVLAGNQLIETKNIIIATGSSSPAIESDFEDIVVEPKILFKEREIPGSVVIVGKSPVAVELAQIFSMMEREVTLISDSDGIMPKADPYISNYILNKLKKDKIKLITNHEISSIKGSYDKGKLTLASQEIACDLVVNARDRKANLVESEVEFFMNDGFYKVDEYFETSVNGIYAVGDVNGISMYAHAGSAQGINVVNRLKGIDSKLDMKKLPMNMYTVPEAAQIGYTEAELKISGIDYKISEFPLSANGKAQTEGNSEGFLRILSETIYGEVLGVQIVSPNATDMINEASAYMQLESTVYDIAQTVHTHPTVSEIFLEAGFEAVDKAIHK